MHGFSRVLDEKLCINYVFPKVFNTSKLGDKVKVTRKSVKSAYF